MSTEHRERKCSKDHRFSFWKNNWKTIAFYGINKDSLKGTGSTTTRTGMLTSGYSYKTVLLHTGNLQHKLVYDDLLPRGKPPRSAVLNFYVHVCYLPLTTVSSKLSMKMACPSNRQEPLMVEAVPQWFHGAFASLNVIVRPLESSENFWETWSSGGFLDRWMAVCIWTRFPQGLHSLGNTTVRAVSLDTLCRLLNSIFTTTLQVRYCLICH